MIAVYCGHGRSTDGTWDCGTTYNGYTEAGLMLEITKAAVKYLRRNGVEVITDADNGNNLNMIKQVAEANVKKVDLFISIHCDYYKATTGTMPLYLSNKGKNLASLVNQSIMADMKMKTRGLTKRPDLYELTETTMPAVVLETGSIKADLEKLKQADKYGKAIARGICAYLNKQFVQDEFKIKAKGNLIVREKASLVSSHIFTAVKGKTYTVTEVHGTRGKLKECNGWITITNKYITKE